MRRLSDNTYDRQVPAWPRPSGRQITRLALAAVIANTVIVVTGALVRLTGSGLGCPTWPRCTDSSFVTTREYGIHGVIEFGNRMLGFPVAAVVMACVAATMLQRPRRRDLVLLSWALLAGVATQGVLGGITVLTHLNPWIVAGHFLVSMALIAIAVALHVRSAEADGPVQPVVPRQVRWLGWALLGVAAAVL
ncbi:MAG: COX15/CtaA family protein, partial [Actinobacteria bacterium]|nr:COX15/CtaA family protein [Actinomycetota bacterium]